MLKSPPQIKGHKKEGLNDHPR